MTEVHLPFLIVFALSLLILTVAHTALIRYSVFHGLSKVMRQVILLVLSFIAVVSVVLTLPVSESTRNELLGLLGLVITAVVAFSSTTFVANAMAGLMLRAVKSFQLGDFIRVQGFFGRVTERGLFHTEIQSEDRDLVTLPNLFLTTQAVSVIRASGTIISCDLSLGYDVPYYRVEPLLKQAALDAGLRDPFIQILELGDHAITYKAAGLGVDVKQVLTLRTGLRKAILDQLHGADIEIVSPSFMNQRRLDASERFLSRPGPLIPEEGVQPPEKGIFDKAERAEKIKLLRDELNQLKESLEDIKEGEKIEQTSLRRTTEARIKQLERILSVARDKVDE